MQISVVLFRPQFSGNLGSIARVMKNTGLKDLRLVRPKASPKTLEAKKMAVHAREVLEKAKTYHGLAEACHGMDLVVGTSRRKGKERGNWLSPRELGEYCQSLPKVQRVAIVFGPEDTGLGKDEVSFCQRLAHIPSNPQAPSYNLSQAVGIVAYELLVARLQGGTAPEPADPKDRVAKVQAVESMYDDLHHLLNQSGFLDKNNPAHMMRLLRKFLNRARPTEREVKILRGIFRQLRWWAGE